ncbi:MAG: potassium channel family protein [Patescibacteria group bacterium]
MHVIIVGCGRVGAGLAMRLADEGHDVVVVDRDPETFTKLGSTFNGLTIAGAVIDRDVLRQAGADKADALAAVTSIDNVNLMCAQVARDIFGIPRVVARTNEPGRRDVFHGFSLVTVCPTDLGVAALQSMLLVPGAQARMILGAGEVVLAEFALGPKQSGWTLGELEIPGKARVVSLIRGGNARVAEPETTCQPGDVLVVAARLDTLEIFRSLLEKDPGEPAERPHLFGKNGSGSRRT